jgi:hypothetical protein
MTNKEVLEVRVYAEALEQQFFNKETKFEIPQKLLYATQKFFRKTKGIFDEQQEMFKDFQKVFKEESGYNEKQLDEDKEYKKIIDAKYREFLEKEDIIETIKKFNEQECEIEFFKVDKEVLESSIIPSEFLDAFEKLV